MSQFWEAIQAMGMKFLWDTYDHLGYPHTKFRPILRGHVQNFGELIWNYLNGTLDEEIYMKQPPV